ncbi:hypothetical protein CHARACLAT_024962 [Characodon lateralis]|uniref:Uncharacterized protein n=1 Tax=Characodon lateralis TaxID=208331 RepID=A0ABU7F732_9TELE|nr:hypothetical protein [Characodon lateralis]
MGLEQTDVPRLSMRVVSCMAGAQESVRRGRRERQAMDFTAHRSAGKNDKSDCKNIKRTTMAEAGQTESRGGGSKGGYKLSLQQLSCTAELDRVEWSRVVLGP